jgi:hypothetical protein
VLLCAGQVHRGETQLPAPNESPSLSLPDAVSHSIAVESLKDSETLFRRSPVALPLWIGTVKVRRGAPLISNVVKTTRTHLAPVTGRSPAKDCLLCRAVVCMSHTAHLGPTYIRTGISSLFVAVFQHSAGNGSHVYSARSAIPTRLQARGRDLALKALHQAFTGTLRASTHTAIAFLPAKLGPPATPSSRHTCAPCNAACSGT